MKIIIEGEDYILDTKWAIKAGALRKFSIEFGDVYRSANLSTTVLIVGGKMGFFRLLYNGLASFSDKDWSRNELADWLIKRDYRKVMNIDSRVRGLLEEL
jgi:hypothetical protein